MANYQIKLTPVDTFFFGGEKHIQNKEGDYETNYFVESNAYPQQTTLLGLVRYYLLLKNRNIFDGKKITDKTIAADMIGSASFDYDNPQCGFKKIKTISPLYFAFNNESYFFAPLDLGFQMSDQFQLYKMDEKGKPKNYNAKDHYFDICQWIISINGNPKKLDDIIKTDPQIGNEKTRKGETKDNKFYKQLSKRMAEAGWSFCIDAEVEDGSGIPVKDSLFIPFGGEKSFFKLEVEMKDQAEFGEPRSFRRPFPYFYCQSDCFVSAGILDQAKLTINQFVSFRNLRTTVANTEKYSGLSAKDTKQMDRSNRFNLLQRGSILYFDNRIVMETVAEAITKDKTHCKNIGFNQIFKNTQNQ